MTSNWYCEPKACWNCCNSSTPQGPSGTPASECNCWASSSCTRYPWPKFSYNLWYTHPFEGKFFSFWAWVPLLRLDYSCVWVFGFFVLFYRFICLLATYTKAGFYVNTKTETLLELSREIIRLFNEITCIKISTNFSLFLPCVWRNTYSIRWLPTRHNCKQKYAVSFLKFVSSGCFNCKSSSRPRLTRITEKSINTTIISLTSTHCMGPKLKSVNENTNCCC